MIILVERIRLSIGTALRLGLIEGPDDPNFTTAFLMTYHPEKCDANCAFCPQARESVSSADRLSRISWPEYFLDEVVSHWPESPLFSRICIQSLCYENVTSDVIDIARRMREITDRPISLAIHPISQEEMLRLKEAGITTIGIALDACTPALFDEVKGSGRNSSYLWKSHIEGLETALEVFGKGNVTTHLIIGLGETEKQATEFIIDMYKRGITVGLFAFTAIRGTSLEGRPQPNLGMYRRIQIIRYLAHRGLLEPEMIHYDAHDRVSIDMTSDAIRTHINSGAAFRVSGCPGCNRPYYNERPSGTMYNYPTPLSSDDVERAIQESELMQ
jgi:biotin synthase